MKDVFPTPPPTPARTVEIRLSIHLPEGTRLQSDCPGEREGAAMARWLTEAVNTTLLPAWTCGPIGRALALPIQIPTPGGAR